MRRWNRRTLLNNAQGGTGADHSYDKDAEDNITRASLDGGSGNSPFEIGIVEEVISNPYDFFNRPYRDLKIGGQPLLVGDVFSGRVQSDDEGQALESPYMNAAVVDYAPANSIVVFLNSNKSASSGSKAIICFPFFSSHLMMPVKPGETVWVMKFNRNIYYWFCRKASFRQIEDLNFTFSQREENVKSLPSSDDENSYTHFKGSTSRGSRLNFQRLLNLSSATREEFTGEPVPRQVKDCGDFLIQGSNNAHIYLGKEKFEEIGTTISQEVFTSVTSPEEANPFRKPISPALDLCVLRKSRELFELKSITSSNTLTGDSISVEGEGLGAVAGSQIPPSNRFYENEKTRDLLEGKDTFPEEFKDSDIYNCAARVYLTNARTIDDLLFSYDYSGEPDLSASPQDVQGLDLYGAMVAMGTNARLVGTETIKIHNVVGRSGIQFTPQGDVIVFANEDGGAKIVLEASGDIRVVPGADGILKLGSDDAVGGIVAASNSIRTLGEVESPTIVTTAGGLVSAPASPATGMFSNKVLIAVSPV